MNDSQTMHLLSDHGTEFICQRNITAFDGRNIPPLQVVFVVGELATFVRPKGIASYINKYHFRCERIFTTQVPLGYDKGRVFVH